MKEQIEALQAEVVELTRIMKEKALKNQDAEVKELSDKLTELRKEFAERKQQFDLGLKSTLKMDSAQAKHVGEKMDELYIASVLLTKKDGQLNKAAYDALAGQADYRDAIKAFVGQTSADAEGGDFIPSGFSSTLMEEIWLKLEIANLFKRFTMTAPTFTFPFSPDRVRARKGAEGVAPSKDKFATDQIIFTAKKVIANIDFTDEIEADSIVAMLPLVRAKLIEGFAIAQEELCLNGDVDATSANINGDIFGADAEDVRLHLNGIRKRLGSGEKVDFATGGFSADNLRALRAKMGKYGKSPADLAYIMTMKDYNKALGFAGYQALYQYAGAVTTTGELGRIDNIPIIVTELLPETGLNASGVVTADATKTTCGLVNKNAYMWGDRKTFALETFRNIYTQSTSLVGSQRLDFQKVLLASSPTAAFGVNY
jgi:HK97 family phage major capsid protein